MSSHNRVTARVSLCLFASRLSCMRTRTDLIGALVQRSAEGVGETWDRKALQNKEDLYRAKHRLPQTCTHSGYGNMVKNGSGARYRKRPYATEKHSIGLLMDVHGFFMYGWMESHMRSEVTLTHALTRARLLANGLPHLHQPLNRVGVAYEPRLEKDCQKTECSNNNQSAET